MFGTLVRLTRALLVSVVALSTAVGSLPDVICCCNVSFGPAGMLIAPTGTVPAGEHRCSCCRRKAKGRREASRPVVARDASDCRFHLGTQPEAIRTSSESVAASLATPLDFEWTPSFCDRVELSRFQPAPDFESWPLQGLRGCALRQVWLI